MARTELAVVSLVPNGSVVNGSGTAGTADGHFIDCHKRTKINDDVKPEHLLLEVTIATAETDVTLKAGDYPPALAAGYGDKVYALAVGTHKLGPFDSGRFMRGDGQVWIDYETAANVTIRAWRVPRNTSD